MIRILCVGKLKERWLAQAVEEYMKRLGAFTKIEIIELKDEKIEGNPELIKKNEGKRIIDALKDDFAIALEITGKELSSEELSEIIKNKTLQNKKTTFIIGGALGLSEEVMERCQMRISLSRMTFTHQMARLVLVEQIYRAFMIAAGREYHK